MRPVLYLDVDGVINIIKSAKKGKPHCWPDIRKQMVDSPIEGDDRRFRITWSPMMIRRLLALDCDIEWLTTWEDDANKTISPLVGLPDDLRVAGTMEGYRDQRETGLFVVNSYNWKLDSLGVDQTANPRPFIWADDDAITFGAKTLLKENVKVPYKLIIPPSSDGGLTIDHLDEMAEFIKSL